MTQLTIHGEDFHLDGHPTHPGRQHRGRRIEGLLFTSRMVQAIFDDANPETRMHWAYPDTGTWDATRNVREFIARLPEYHRRGLDAVCVGLQGGGPRYRRPEYDQYRATAFRPDGSLDSAWFDRLHAVLIAADQAGLVVIVNYLYWRQERFSDEAAVRRAVEGASQWLLASGFRNLVINVRNEITDGPALTQSRRIHELIDIVRATTLGGRRLPVGTSTFPKQGLAPGPWQDLVDLFMPHGNDSTPDEWRRELREIRASDSWTRHPRPILCDEDSIHLDNLEVAVDEHVSWGYYDQGHGCSMRHGRFDWSDTREARYEDLSGFQTMPVNWAINTEHKRAFFDRLSELTGRG